MPGSISSTPRNQLLGLLADGLKSGSDFLTQNSLPDGVRPYNIPSAKGLLDMLGIPAVANTLNEMSYGGALGTGSGMTWKPKSDTVDAALAVSPLLAKAPKVANAGLGLLGDTMAANAVRHPNMSQAGAIKIPQATSKINKELIEQPYWMGHRPSQTGATAADVTQLSSEMGLPKDFYINPHFYEDLNNPSVKESFDILKKIRGNPNADVTIYRASPKDILNAGDWVSLSKKYAMGESAAEGVKVYPYKVKAKDIEFAGDSINEFGFFPK